MSGTFSPPEGFLLIGPRRKIKGNKKKKEREGTLIKCLIVLALEPQLGTAQTEINYQHKSSKMLVFEERGNRGTRREITVQSRKPTNSTHISCTIWESNPGHIGLRRVLSPLRHPCIPCRPKGLVSDREKRSPIS